MSKSITQDMRYRQSLMQYTAKYGVSRASRKIVGCGDSFLSQLSVCFVVPQVKNNTKERAKHGIYQKARQQ